MNKLLHALGLEGSGDLRRLLWQFIKFGLVGVSNTLITYGVEQLCYYVLFRNVTWPERALIFTVTSLGFAAGTVNSWFWNSRFVFEAGKETGGRAKRFLKMTLCYALTGLVLGPILKLWLTGLGLPYWLASLLVLVVTVPVNFILNKLWAFRKKAEPDTDEGRNE